MSNQIISHYKIIEKIGEGGMGAVYKAEDIKLNRIVALKFLPPYLSSDSEAKKRFINEARTASSLDHPNICTIYEVGETEEGQLFIAMAYYQGETLKTKISKGKIELKEAIIIFLQICNGIEKAHQYNIIHRDIKPANIFLTNDGIAKILDFGLAKIKGHTRFTSIGTTAGTVEYMSPEQAIGEEVDHRTDIWSLGVLFYEMISGSVPFDAAYDQAVIYSILNTEPDLDKIPKELRHIVKKALAKSLSERYQCVKEIIFDLISQNRDGKAKNFLTFSGRKIFSFKNILISVIISIVIITTYISLNKPGSAGTTPVTINKKMIVVLPFENLGIPDYEYLSQGMREEISSKLASFSNLGVISRNSAEICAKSKKTIKEIGKELGVDYILEGTLQWTTSQNKTSRVRIIPQLIRVSDDINIWSDSYDRVVSDIFYVQDEISQNVADRIGVNIFGKKISGTPPTKNLDAYDYYLKALQFQSIVSSNSDLLTCIRLHEKAIELDSNFAQAHAMVSIAYMAAYQFIIDSDAKVLQKASEHLEKATKLNSNLGEVHLANAFNNYWVKKNVQKSWEEFNKTIEIQPNNAEAHFWVGQFYEGLWDNYDLGLKYLSKAAVLDPLVTRYQGCIGGHYLRIKKFKNAEKYFKRQIELAPYAYSSYVELAENYIAWKGNTKLARETVSKIKGDEYLEDYYNIFTYLNILDRNFDKALNELKTSKKEYANSWQMYFPNSEMIALVYKYKNNLKASRAYFDSSRIKLERLLVDNPDDVRIHSSLCIAYAGLGEKQKALIENEKTMKLFASMSNTKHRNLLSLLRIYTLTGDYNNALNQMDLLLSGPQAISINNIKIDPFYDALRNHPDYQRIVEKYSRNIED